MISLLTQALTLLWFYFHRSWWPTMQHALCFVWKSWAFGLEYHEELANPFISPFVKLNSFWGIEVHKTDKQRVFMVLLEPRTSRN